jgi:diguanylate cyclase (GGDEF)-like protein
MNTVTIFWCLSAILYICSRNSQELEGKLVEYNNQLERQANTDQLTGLYNRRKAMQYLETLVKRAGENNTGFCLCICDIDLFKRVNDTYGHDFGDLVLQSVSSVFLDETKKGIFAARWGGEEFLLVFPSQNGDQAKIILEDIQYKIRNTKVKKGEQETGVTMTFGLAEYDFANGIDATIKDADEKLYLGKTGGRDKIVF